MQSEKIIILIDQLASYDDDDVHCENYMSAED